MRWIGIAVPGIAALVIWLWPLTQDEHTEDGYFVLAVSWTPSWCAAEGAARGDARCAAGAGRGWLVHGLWPQHEAGGWPEFCDTDHRPPNRRLTSEMRDIMGSDGLARHQWAKHGTCSGLAPSTYFDHTRDAFEALAFPEAIRAREAPLRRAPDEILTSFRAANPGIGPDMAILTCRAGDAQEIRLCLTRDLEPRRCDAQLLARRCQAEKIALPVKP